MARKTSGRRLPIAGPKRTETPNPGQVNAPFQAPGAEAPEAPKKNVTKTELGLSDFQRNLAAGKPVGDYETRGSTFDFGGKIGEMKAPTAISDNTAHIDALHAMANEASARLIGIGKERSEETLGKKGVKANDSTFKAMGPATASLDKAKVSFANAHLAHLAGDAISSTIHVKEGAQHLVNAVNHLESGDVWGAVNAKGNAKSSFRSWRADPTDGFKPTISLAGAFHSKVAAAVNGYTQHVMKAADKNTGVADQLDHADLSPVSYTPADSDTKSPLIKTPTAAQAAPVKELSPEEQTLADAKAAALKNTNTRNAQKAGTVKKEKVPNYNNFAQIYEAAKKHAAKQIGKPDKTGKVYTQEMHDEEFAPIPKEEQPVVTPKTKPARNKGSGSYLEDERVANSTPFGYDEPDEGGSATTKNVFNSQVLSHLGYNAPKEDRETEPEIDEPVELPDEKIEEVSDAEREAMMAPTKSRKKKSTAAAPAPAAGPVKEARYDVFNAARTGGQ
jgi:hypothetical protein